MTEIPRRLSLVAQTADILRRDLQRGEWTNSLPGEKSLCERLQVSRPTVRAALAILRRERFIELAKGRRPRITITARQLVVPSESKAVGFLSGLAWEEMESYTLFRISELRAHLQNAGYKLEVHADPHLDRQRTFGAMQRLVRETKACCWLLHLIPPTVQRWFDGGGIRAIVLGSPPENVQFPSIDLHYRAIARHAAGVLLGLGHRRIALLLRNTRQGGDLASEQGFREGVEMAGHADVVPRIHRHDSSVKNICSQLSAIFRGRSRPTALLVRNPGSLLTVVTYLLHSGIRVPQDVSLIALDDERYLNHLTPSIARYRTNWNAYAARLSRMVTQLATTGSLAARRILVMPEFEEGETLAPPRHRLPRS